MTRSEIIEAGARAIYAVRPHLYDWKWEDAEPSEKAQCRREATAMLPAITEGMGNKLMGREPDRAIISAVYRAIQARAFDLPTNDEIGANLRAAWDAAPWVPGGEK